MLTQIFKRFVDINNVKCYVCSKKLKVKMFNTNFYLVCEKCKCLSLCCKNCKYHSEVVLLKYLGNDGIVSHPHYNRILRPNRKQIYKNEDTFGQDTSKENTSIYKLKCEFEKIENFPIFIPYYVGDKNLYYVNQKGNVSNFLKPETKNEKSYWCCEICKKTVEVFEHNHLFNKLMISPF